MSREDFDVFWNTHLHGSESGSGDTTVLFWHCVREEASSFPWARRESTVRQHPMCLLARDLLTQVRVAGRKTALEVTVLQNFSPCADCAAELIKAVTLARERKVKLDVCISFVGFRGVRLASCSARGFTCATNIGLNESGANALALRLLTEEGVKVRTFTPALWQFLHTFCGLGVPSAFPGSYLSGRYGGPGGHSRAVEDSIVQTDLRLVLQGLHITSAAFSADSDAYNAEWKPPKLPSKAKVTEYRLTYKKVSLKKTDVDERSWRILQTLPPAPLKVVVPGELCHRRQVDLDRDSHYELTVEALLGQVVVGSSRRIFKTEDKVSIASLASPRRTPGGTTLRRTSSMSTASISSRLSNGISR